MPDSTPAPVADLLVHVRWARRIARSLTPGDRVDDALQDAAEVWIRNPPRTASTPRAWLRAVIFNVIRHGDRRDHHRTRREQIAMALRPAVETPEELTARVELERFIADRVLTLAERYRQVVMLRYYEGLSSAEIARALNVPAGTIRRRLKVGLDRIRAALPRSPPPT